MMRMSICFKALDLTLSVQIEENEFNLQVDKVFDLGCRVNPKRSFLFVSKLIGKHLPVVPDLPRATGYLLAEKMIRARHGVKHFDTNTLVDFVHHPTHNYPELKALFEQRYPLTENTLFIGFAETATGLGHSVYSAFKDASYIHTTREPIQGEPYFEFKEPHSHATDHACYFKQPSMLSEAEHIVLIDDEITTGNTAINLIRALHEKSPKKRYTVLSILDWRKPHEKEAFIQLGKELNADVAVLSLLSGEFQVDRDIELAYEEEVVKTDSNFFPTEALRLFPRIIATNKHNELPISYPVHSGRFGMDEDIQQEFDCHMDHIASHILASRSQGKILVLSFGEFMYVPSRIASHLGENVYVKTVTRSPIYPHATDYPIYERYAFIDDDGVTNYLYNISKEQYDQVFFILERNISDKTKSVIYSILQQCGVRKVRFVLV